MRAMIGEWTGNVRSTPTPKLSLRTVKVSRTPLPWRRITTPWNTWMRSRVPSTTRTWTLTVSPGLKAGTSSRRLPRSTRSVGFMARQAPQVGGPGRSRLARGRAIVGVDPLLRQQASLLVGEAAATFHQVRAVVHGPEQRLGPPPAGDATVVAGPQDLGNLVAPEVGGAGVLGVLEEAVAERLVLGARLVAHDARQQAADRLEHDHRRHLAPAQHVV